MDKKNKKQIKTKMLPNSQSVGFKFFKTIDYEFYIFSTLLLLSLPVFEKITPTWQADVYYYVHVFDYSIGFAPRLFIGSVMSLFTQYKSAAFLTAFMHSSHLLSYIFYAFIAGRFIRKASEEMREVAIYLVALFIALPFTFGAISFRSISLDFFTLFFTFLMLVFLNKPVFKWLVPVLIFMSLATYHQYAFLYMPIIAILLLYEIQNNKNSKNSIFFSIVSFSTMVAFTAYFYLFDGIKRFGHQNDLLAFAENKSDLIFGETAKNIFQGYFLTSPFEVFRFYSYAGSTWAETLNLDDIIVDLPFLEYLIPMFIFFFFVWKNAFKNSDSKFEKFIFLLCILAPLSRLPSFVLMAQDYLRIWVAVMTVQFFLLFYFLHNRNAAVTESMSKAWSFVRAHYFLSLMLIVFYAMSYLTFGTSSLFAQFTAGISDSLS